MLPKTFWSRIEGTVLDGKVRVGALLRAECGLFTAESLDFTAESLDDGTFGDAGRLTVRFMRAGSEPVLERYLEASYLAHPNLLRCFSAGTVELAGTVFVYAVLERAESTLADVESERPITADEAKELGTQLISALRYLHERELVYCNLDPSTVARAGNEWKLFEYSQLRVVGPGYARETRRMLTLSAGTPPEAWDGTVSPAWDAWGVAWLLAGTVSEGGTGARDSTAIRDTSRRRLSAPFSSIISDCMKANPAERCGLTRIEDLLHKPVVQPLSASEPGTPAPAPTKPAMQPVSVREPEIPAMVSMRLARLRAFNPKQAMWTAAVFAAGFVLIATLVYHPYQSSHTAAVAAAPPRAAAVRPVAEMIRLPSGEADRAVADSNSPKRLVELWADAIRTRNLDAQIACYAPRVYAFYGLAHVTPEDIGRRRAAAMGRYNDVRQLEISNIEVRMESPTAATATFDERWDFIGRDPSSGKVQERLRMRKVDGEWRITSESNMKTYFKNGPNPQS